MGVYWESLAGVEQLDEQSRLVTECGREFVAQPSFGVEGHGLGERGAVLEPGDADRWIDPVRDSAVGNAVTEPTQSSG